MFLAAKQVSKLRRGSRFSGPVHANHQNDFGTVRKRTEFGISVGQNLFDVAPSDLDYLFGGNLRIPLLKGLDDLQCHRDADIGTNQSFFQLIPINGLPEKRSNKSLKNPKAIDRCATCSPARA